MLITPHEIQAALVGERHRESAKRVLRSAASAITSQANFSAKIRQKVLVNCLFRQVTEGDELPI
ncbi:hypothetical protein [Phenylobacterium sp.]|uniref:hypothetical protein n=1 Tax=Phenylobacterium sp. TaxID=1871053 RepID=UPI00374D5494